MDTAVETTARARIVPADRRETIRPPTPRNTPSGNPMRTASIRPCGSAYISSLASLAFEKARGRRGISSKNSTTAMLPAANLIVRPGTLCPSPCRLVFIHRADVGEPRRREEREDAMTTAERRRTRFGNHAPSGGRQITASTPHVSGEHQHPIDKHAAKASKPRSPRWLSGAASSRLTRASVAAANEKRK